MPNDTPTIATPWTAEQLDAAAEKARGGDAVTLTAAADALRSGHQLTGEQVTEVQDVLSRYGAELDVDTPPADAAPDHWTRDDIDEALGALGSIASALGFILGTMGHTFNDEGDVVPLQTSRRAKP